MSDTAFRLNHQTVVNVVGQLTARKIKPDVKNIKSALVNHQEILENNPLLLPQIIDECLAYGKLVLVRSSDGKSLRQPEKLIGMSRACKIIPYSGRVNDSIVEDILKLLGEIEPSTDPESTKGSGVDVVTLVIHIHNQLRFLNYTNSMVETILRKAIHDGFATRLSNGKYSLTQMFRLLHSIPLRIEVGPIAARFKISHTSHENKASGSKEPKADKKDCPTRVSSRQRKPKTHGPDFIEEHSIPETVIISACVVCKCPVDSNRASINCTRCVNAAHEECLQLHSKLGTTSQWLCGSCAICCVCRKLNREDFLLCCVQCRRGFHCECFNLEPNLLNRRSSWQCEACSFRSQPLPSIQPTGEELYKDQSTHRVKHNFYIWLEYELKYLMRKLDYESLLQLPNCVEKWCPEEVQFFASTIGFSIPEGAFQEINGSQFLALTKEELIEKLGLGLVSSVKLSFIIDRLNSVLDGQFYTAMLRKNSIELVEKVSLVNFYDFNLFLNRNQPPKLQEVPEKRIKNRKLKQSDLVEKNLSRKRRSVSILAKLPRGKNLEDQKKEKKANRISTRRRRRMDSN